MGLPWIRSDWRESAPELIASAARRWNVEIEARLGGLASQVVACRNAEGHELVLKVAPPEAYPDHEAAALQHWSGNGAVQFVDFAPDLGALLMERITPGSPLPSGHDEELTALVAATLLRLHSVSTLARGAFPTQEEFFAIWLERCPRIGGDRNGGADTAGPRA